MPLYKVKPERTIEHENVCYFEGDVVELAFEYGAFHEPNIVVVPKVVDAEVVPTEEDEEDEDDAKSEEEKSSSSLVWYR